MVLGRGEGDTGSSDPGVLVSRHRYLHCTVPSSGNDAMRCCDACGRYRDEGDVSHIEYKGLDFYYCNGDEDMAPTCYQQASRGALEDRERDL